MSETRKNIVWLASYPKSGNTWVRIFLANYLLNRSEPIPINEVHRVGIGDAIAKTYRMVARRPIDVTDPDTTLALRPDVLNAIVRNGADVNLVKTHNRRDTARGIDLIPPALTRLGIYILRDPRDVVLSYARHYAMTPAATVAAFARDDHAISGDSETVPQYLGSWSQHVRRWTRHTAFPVLTLRYEDLKADPAGPFTKLLRRIGMPVEPDRLDRAIRFSSFDEVSRQESAGGFVEKSAASERFFHSGLSGGWRDTLDPELAARIEADHGTVMKRHGYL